MPPKTEPHTQTQPKLRSGDVWKTFGDAALWFFDNDNLPLQCPNGQTYTFEEIQEVSRQIYAREGRPPGRDYVERISATKEISLEDAEISVYESLKKWNEHRRLSADAGAGIGRVEGQGA